MAVNPVSLAETLRPWHGLGVTCLLRDPVWAEEAGGLQEFSDSSGNGSPSSLTEGAAPSLSFARSGAIPLQTPVAGGEAKQIPPSAQKAPQHAVAAQENVSVSKTEGASFPQQQTVPSLKDAETLPETHPPPLPSASHEARDAMRGTATRVNTSEMPGLWQRLLERTQAAPLLWTYAELGSDLHAQGNSEESRMRSQTLRGLIGGLSLPKGSSCFWPLTLSEDWADALRLEQPVQDAVFFHLGLERLAPKSIVLLGRHSATLAGLHPNLKLPFTQQIAQGKLLVLLPSFADLQANTATQTKATAYLRSAFSNFPALFI